jgi:sulfite oxidase
MTQRPDEWKLEQGLAPRDGGIGDKDIDTYETIASKNANGKTNGIDPYVAFAEEKKGWKGYIEWEKYPEKRAQAASILNNFKFPPPPEFQLGPVPDTNPVLDGLRWKLWHKAVGGVLTDVPEESWRVVLREKHPDMLHLLQFPYNGEPPKVSRVTLF